MQVLDRRTVLKGLLLAGVGLGLQDVGRFLWTAGAAEGADSPIFPYEAGRFKELGGITPNDVFYTQSYSNTPHMETSTWSINMGGLVEQPLQLTYADLLALPAVEEMRTLACIGNPVGYPLTGNAIWTGVRLRSILDRVGIKEGVKEAIMRAGDGYSTSVPLKRILGPDVLLVYRMNGVPLSPVHGFPVRILIPGLYGQKQPKWITEIEFTDEPYQGFFEKRGWSNKAAVKVFSRFDAPARGQTIRKGLFTLGGIAFTNESGIARVEVSMDNAHTWAPASLYSGPNARVWTPWRFDWKGYDDGRFRLQVRATDREGRAQSNPSFRIFSSDAFPSGTSAIHALTVRVKQAG